MYIPVEKFNLPIKYIKLIANSLMKEATDNIGPCPNCNVEIGNYHLDRCTLSICEVCNFQYISCGCKKSLSIIWNGYYDGTLEAYKKLYITYSCMSKRWIFDYNKLYMEK